jgi:hypothetical protein
MRYVRVCFCHGLMATWSGCEVEIWSFDEGKRISFALVSPGVCFLRQERKEMAAPKLCSRFP